MREVKGRKEGQRDRLPEEKRGRVSFWHKKDNIMHGCQEECNCQNFAIREWHCAHSWCAISASFFRTVLNILTVGSLMPTAIILSYVVSSSTLSAVVPILPSSAVSGLFTLSAVKWDLNMALGAFVPQPRHTHIQTHIQFQVAHNEKATRKDKGWRCSLSAESHVKERVEKPGSKEHNGSWI